MTQRDLTIMSSVDVRHVLDAMHAMWPDPGCFLTYTTDFSLLVAVMLSAQCTDNAVNRIMPDLIMHADTPEKMVALGIDGVKPLIQTIGLFHRKAQYSVACAHHILDQHNGRVPSTLSELVALPGVGRKTANVVLNVVFGYPTIPVDTHVFRVARRLGLSTGSTVNAVEHDLNRRIDMPYKQHVHAWLIMHGRTYCHARRPNCSACPVAQYCMNKPD